MTDPLDSELDQLFAQPPSEMVGFRNALSDRLRKAGDRDAATRIKALKRPTTTVWALNRVHFQSPELIEQARAASTQLHMLHAQNGVEPAQLSAAIDAQRKAMQVVIDAAMEHCRKAVLPADAAHERRVYTTLQAWLAGAGEEAPGRMTVDIEPRGFDAVTAFAIPAPRPAPPPTATKPTSTPAEPGAQAESAPQTSSSSEAERAAAHVVQCEQRARAASEETGRQRAAFEQGQRELERAQRQLGDAEQAVHALRVQLGEREALLVRLQRGVEAAESVERAARTDVEATRAAAPRKS